VATLVPIREGANNKPNLYNVLKAVDDGIVDHQL
jgi:hypothetical protein